MTSTRFVVESANILAQALPANTVDALAEAILTSPIESLRAEISRRIAHHHHRDLALAFVDRWRSEHMELDPCTVAVALQSASLSEQKHRDSQSVELVWTGPDTGVTSFRRTEQAVLQVLDSAKSDITLISFAVYRIPNVCNALVRAAKRGVRLTVIVETPDRIVGVGEYSTIRAIGPDVAACSTVYFWPKENRPVGETSKVGLLHVKCAVADGKWLFLSSANLTQQAFTINMELGILVSGGSIPMQVREHFARLIHTKQLKLIENT
jgi:phosphatidylserine/phosphatidylglycerophosphate/cardiolipin synthase-like enzyme